MNDKKVLVAYEVGSEVVLPDLHKEEGFTTNKNYLGHNIKGIPVYKNDKLLPTQTKNIEESDFEELAPGRYTAFVAQVYSKVNKNDSSKKYITIELDVKDQPKRQYVTFFIEGYNPKVIEINQNKINWLLDAFDIDVLDQLAGKEVTLKSVKNEAGYINYNIFPLKNFYEWESDCQLPCEVIKFYETNDKKKYNLLCKVKLGKEIYDDIVTIRKDNEFDIQNFAYFLEKAKLTIEDMSKDINVKCIFKVVKSPSKKDPTKVYTNKKITFPREVKKVKESHWVKK